MGWNWCCAADSSTRPTATTAVRGMCLAPPRRRWWPGSTTELVWLPDELYEVRTPLGDELISIRSSLLSAKRVRDAFLGYPTQQFRRLENRGDGSFSADLRKRTAKK